MTDDLHLVIANKAYSSWSMRPWFALKAQSIPFRETVICLFQPETAAQLAPYSPTGKVPVLQHDGVTVWDSLAIIEYIAETFPDRPWWPQERAARAMARSISAEMHSGFQSLRTHMSMNVRRDWAGKGRGPGVVEDIARIQAIWAEARSRFGGGGPFLFGKISNADAMYAPVVTRFKTYGVVLDAVGQAYCDAMLAHPAMKQWYADAAKETWVIEKYESAA